MITKKIVINYGDEYRAKIEKNFNKEEFFFESYQRAARCVNEIVNDALIYMESFKCNGNSNGHAFYDYGNNMVVFCAERGQGKTSAMLSFSGELERFGKTNEDNLLRGILNERDCLFEILESIDPTMIKDGVGVLKVFLSRLFYHFQDYLSKKDGRGKDFEFSNNYQRLLSCFKKCYTNIEYLQTDFNKEWNLDDLDMLSQIGDSSNLKNNIHELVSLYFEIKYGGKKEKCFLVVQIDDADLAIGNASDICENVRKFLKIPGIIVLMAADYEQLKHVFNQKYHREYERLIRDNQDFGKKCEKMATKYLEKILPHSHRVELPKLQKVIGEEHTNLLIEYNLNDHSQFSKEFSGCKDIQEQLIKFIYLRTGIILLKSEEKMHPFLPCRLRELTHLIKLLSEMEAVDYNHIFELAENSVERAKAVEMLQGNLLMFKSYFMRDWCINRLSQTEQELLAKIDEIKINESVDGEDDSQIYRILSEYLKLDYKAVDKKDRTHKRIINDLVIDGLSDRPELQSALFLYYSIYLNIRFAYALENEAEYQRIMKWLDCPMEVPLNVRTEKYGEKYYFPYFEFDYRIVKRQFEKSPVVGLTRRWFELFCRPKQEKKLKVPKNLFVSVRGNNKEILGFNKELTKAEFDLLQPLNAIFYKGFLQEWRREVNKGIVQPNDSLGDVVPGEEETFVWENLEIAAVHKSVKNIIANYDVQRCLISFIEKEYQYVHLKKDFVSWRLSCENLYKNLDIKYEQVFGFLDTDFKLQTIFDKFFNLPRVYACVFLSNKVNKKAYLKEYKEKLRQARKVVLEAVNLFESMPQHEITSDFLEGNFEIRQKGKELIQLEILGERSEVATIDKDVEKLWNIEQQIVEIYDSVSNPPQESAEELLRMQGNIQSYRAVLEKMLDVLKKTKK